MAIRRELKYPPFYYICYIRISGKDKDFLTNESLKIKRALDRNVGSAIILGPSPNNIFKLNNVYRYGIIIKYKTNESLYVALNKIVDHYKSNQKIKIDIDFNPSHF